MSTPNINAKIQLDTSSGGCVLTVLSTSVEDGWLRVENDTGGVIDNVTLTGFDSAGNALTQDSKATLAASERAFLVADDDVAQLTVSVDGSDIGTITGLTFDYASISLDGAGNINSTLLGTGEHPYVLIGSSGTLTVVAASAPTVTGDTGALTTTSTASPYLYDVTACSEVTINSGAPIPIEFIGGSTATLYADSSASPPVPYAVPSVLTPDGAGAVTVTLDPSAYGLWFPGGSYGPGAPQWVFTSTLTPDPLSAAAWLLHYNDDDDDPKIIIKRPPSGSGGS